MNLRSPKSTGIPMLFISSWLLGISVLTLMGCTDPTPKSGDTNQKTPRMNLYKPVWNHKVESFTDELLIHQDFVFVAGAGSILQLSLSTGRLLNEYKLPCESFISLQARNNLLFIYYRRANEFPAGTTTSGHIDLPSLATQAAKVIAFQAENGPACLIALDVTTNSKLWESEGWSVEAKPCLWENRIILKRSPGGVSALDMTTGSMLWESDLYQPNPGSTEMAISQASTFDEGQAKVFKAVSFATGKQVWKTALCDLKPMVLELGPKLSVGKENYFLLLQFAEDKPVYEKRNFTTILCCGNKATGQPAWLDTFANQKAVCPPLLWDEKGVVVTSGATKDNKGGVYAFSLKDGKPIWAQSLKVDPVFAPAIIGDELMLVTQNEDKSYVFTGIDLHSGNVKWKYSNEVQSEFRPGERLFYNVSYSPQYLVYKNVMNVCAFKRRD